MVTIGNRVNVAVSNCLPVSEETAASILELAAAFEATVVSN